MKIIFLDIDGVLNSDVYMASDEYFNSCKDAGIKDHRSYEVVTKAHHLHLDPSAVKLLNSLVEKTEAKVVLSSTWRLIYSLEDLNAMLTRRGATFEVTDKTPSKMSFRLREFDVQEYLSDLKHYKGVVPESFVILDDLPQFPELVKHFVHISEKTGLTQEYVDRAIKILSLCSI